VENPYKILIVDDKELDRNGVCYLIKQYQLELEPLTASSGLEALSILREQTVHILFTDIKMPEMSGHELIFEAKKINPDLKVVIFSSYENFDYAHKAMDLGVTKYLLKPIKIDKFLTCMKSLVQLLREEQTNWASGVYFDVITGRSEMDETDLNRISHSGYIFLLDFVEPFFNMQHLNTLMPVLDNSNLVSIPLNEYQCLFIAPTEESAKDCMHSLENSLHSESNCRFILVYGGYFDKLSHLQQLFEQMEGCSSSKFYITQNTILYINKLPNEKNNIDVKTFLTKSLEISKLISRKELLHAEQEINNIFIEFQKQTYVPTAFAKFVCTEIVRTGLDEGTDHYNDTLLRYISEIEHSSNIDDLKSICISVVKLYSEQHDETMAIDQALEIIHSKYMENISLESVAADVYLSTCYLSYLFKKTNGMNFIKYLTTYRVDVAKNLLRNTKLKVRNICEMVGYSNVSYFCQIFKNHCGMTPAQFRGSKL
jgi:two-component system response regulator YesN